MGGVCVLALPPPTPSDVLLPPLQGVARCAACRLARGRAAPRGKGERGGEGDPPRWDPAPPPPSSFLRRRPSPPSHARAAAHVVWLPLTTSGGPPSPLTCPRCPRSCRRRSTAPRAARAPPPCGLCAPLEARVRGARGGRGVGGAPCVGGRSRGWGERRGGVKGKQRGPPFFCFLPGFVVATTAPTRVPPPTALERERERGRDEADCVCGRERER